ncbi:MAG: alpha/beta hydrolase-fold protein [Solirubrobacteraceae bacterium]
MVRRRRSVIGTAVALAVMLALWACGGTADPQGATVRHYTLDSRLTHGERPQTLVIPRGSDGHGRPLLVILHGRGGDGEDSNLKAGFFAGLRRLGTRAPVVLFPNGSDHSYWHDRRDGAWGRYVLREAIPAALRRSGADPSRIAIGGVSMGGYGALNLARLAPRRFCAVGAHSPALWATPAERWVHDAFDGAADYGRNDVVTLARRDPAAFAGLPVWVDAGQDDPFRSGVDAFTGALRAGGVPVAAHAWPGAHESSYWNDHWPDYLAWYGRRLASCRR